MSIEKRGAAKNKKKQGARERRERERERRSLRAVIVVEKVG